MHLTMTDVLHDPARKVDRVEFRSLATATFLGIAGVTLLEAFPDGKAGSSAKHSPASSK